MPIDRKAFLKDCACTLCGCLAAGAAEPGDLAAAQAAPAEDWRLRFVTRRYAKLLEILSARMDEKTLDATLLDLGTYCSTTDKTAQKYRGDLDGYRDHLRRTASGDDAAYDREKRVITVTSPERKDCFCPLVSVQDRTPAVVCNCSLGWQTGTWQMVTGKKVRVELKESILRGGRRCVFEVHVSDQDA